MNKSPEDLDKHYTKLRFKLVPEPEKRMDIIGHNDVVYTKTCRSSLKVIQHEGKKAGIS